MEEKLLRMAEVGRVVDSKVLLKTLRVLLEE